MKNYQTYSPREAINLIADSLGIVLDSIDSYGKTLEAIFDEIKSLKETEVRYEFLRNADVDSIHKGGVFAGQTPENLVINGEDLDKAIDDAVGI